MSLFSEYIINSFNLMEECKLEIEFGLQLRPIF